MIIPRMLVCLVAVGIVATGFGNPSVHHRQPAGITAEKVEIAVTSSGVNVTGNYAFAVEPYDGDTFVHLPVLTLATAPKESVIAQLERDSRLLIGGKELKPGFVRESDRQNYRLPEEFRLLVVDFVVPVELQSQMTRIVLKYPQPVLEISGKRLASYFVYFPYLKPSEMIPLKVAEKCELRFRGDPTVTLKVFSADHHIISENARLIHIQPRLNLEVFLIEIETMPALEKAGADSAVTAPITPARP